MRLFKSIYSPLSLREGSGVRPLGISLLLLLLSSSCSQESVFPDSDAVEIHLSGDINGLSASTATRGVVDKDHTSALNVCFARLDQNEDGTYPAYTTVATPLSATRAAGSGQTNIGFTPTQYYLTRQTNNNTKLLGWYPAGNYVQAAATVTFDISGGTTDVMMTEEVTANKADKFGNTGRTFTFSHLLTRVSVKAHGDASAKDTWGVIKSVKVKSQPTSCVVTLPSTVSWGSTTVDLALRKTADDAAMGDVSLNGKTTNVNTADCGYAMFKPTNNNSLTLIVTTEKGGAREVTVSLAAGSMFAAGTGYTVTLEFKSTDIAPSASITSWGTGSGVNTDL